MSMTSIVIVALILSFIVYLTVGFVLEKRTKSLGDLLPLIKGREARVSSSKEFSASTVATTVSLATLIVAYFELAAYFGIWLFWTVLSTALGILLVRVFANKIWAAISKYDHRPSLHEFLGNEYGAGSVAFIASICTSLGFLGVLATELTVGSKFLAGLISDIPQWVSVVVLSVVAFVYTAMGGFRAVIVTDRMQMWSIWGLISVLFVFYAYYMGGVQEWNISMESVPENIFNFSWRNGLLPFLIGIFLINTPFYIADMSIWQRIGGAQEQDTVFKGLWSSVLNTASTWSLLVILACAVFLIVSPVEGQNSLVTLLSFIGNEMGVFGKIVLFLSVLGLFGAMLSTASTQLIAVSHTLYEDIISRLRHISLKDRLDSTKELRFSRAILIASAVVSVVIVEVLSRIGFSIADLIFAIYGAQLSLTPLVLFALFGNKELTKSISKWAIAAVSIGFLSGWTAAVTGQIMGIGNLVFLSPGFSLGISLLILTVGYFSASRN